MACFNWTAASLRSWATTLTANNIHQISLFMPTMDGAVDPSTEGRNATSPFFYEVLRDFLDGKLAPTADVAPAPPLVPPPPRAARGTRTHRGTWQAKGDRIRGADERRERPAGGVRPG